MHRLIFSCCFLATSSSLFTHQTSIPEVRKAIPLYKPTTPSPIDAAGDTPIAQPIAITPTDAQFVVAESFYQRKEYQIASVEFQKFLQLSTPGNVHRDQALFHLAETYRLLDKSLEAQSTYQQLLKEIPSGDIAASAAYRIGEYCHDKKELKKGIEAFSQAAQLTKNITIQNAARYQEGLCHDELGDQEKATLPFDEVFKTTEDQTEKITTLMLLANENAKCGRSEKALNAYLSISTESPPKVAAEALVKAGIIIAQQKNKEKALQYFQKAADLKEAEPWSSSAALKFMQLAYDKKDYQKILEKSPQALASSNVEECSQALLLTAQAERQLGYFQKALELDTRLIKEFPGSTSAHDAAFMRLLLLRTLKDPSLLTQLQDFILTTSDTHQRAQATLLQAEVFFQQENYASAAKAYATVQDSDLPSMLKADAAYKEAWSLQHLGDAASALGAYTTFLTAYPEAPTAPEALLQHAYLEQKQGNLKSALADYNHFLEKYSHAPEQELALIFYHSRSKEGAKVDWAKQSQDCDDSSIRPHRPNGNPSLTQHQSDLPTSAERDEIFGLVLEQKALVQAAEHDNHGMIATFQQLLTDYPKSSKAAEANYWVGWNFFEEKNYQSAIPFLKKAKALNVKKFGEKAGLRLVLCDYSLEQPELAMHDAAGLPPTVIPGEISSWIGLKAYERGDLNQAEQFLNQVMVDKAPNLITRDVAMALAKTLIKKEKFQAAKVPAEKALELATDPASRAAAILTLAKIEQELGNYNKAEHLTHEALLLQPEGPLNTEGRLLMKTILNGSG